MEDTLKIYPQSQIAMDMQRFLIRRYTFVENSSQSLRQKISVVVMPQEDTRKSVANIAMD